MTNLLKKYQTGITSLLLALYSLPLQFQLTPDSSVDGNWKTGLNYAVKTSQVFGKDYIFSYGPLAFLTTRNGMYVNPVLFLAGDLLLLCGFYYFISRQITDLKKWLLPLFVAMVFLRSGNYVQNLFLLFIIFYALNFKNNFKNNFELIYCALAGVLLFYIKLNYGIISIAMLLLACIYVLFRKNYAGCTVLLVSGCGFYGIIYANVHLDTVWYTRYGIELIRYYDQAMSATMPLGNVRFLAALLVIALFIITTTRFLLFRLKTSELKGHDIISLFVLGLACYLLYRNGFTRADFVHYYDFFSVFPFFLIAISMLFNYGKQKASAIIVTICLLVSGYVLLYADRENKLIKPVVNFSSLSPVSYFQGIFEKTDYPEKPPVDFKIIGGATVDIMPIEISLLLDNKMNYDPRPIAQSYCAFTPVLDSLNANYFYKQGRPEFILLQSNSIDGRYEFWDESLTKAMIRANYGYVDFMSRIKNDGLETNSGVTYLILHTKNTTPVYPEFEKIATRTVNFGDTVMMAFADSDVIYMTADIAYDAIGKISRLLYHPPVLNVIFNYDDGTSAQYRAIGTLLKTPVLINKAVTDMVDLKNYYTGDLRKNKNIKSFEIKADGRGAQQKIRLSFFRYSNY